MKMRRCFGLLVLFVFAAFLLSGEQAAALHIPRCKEIKRDIWNLMGNPRTYFVMRNACTKNKNKKMRAIRCKQFQDYLRRFYLRYLRVKVENAEHNCRAGPLALRGERKKIFAHKKYNALRCQVIKEGLKSQREKHKSAKDRVTWVCGTGFQNKQLCQMERKKLARWSKIRKVSKQEHKANRCSFPWK